MKLRVSRPRVLFIHSTKPQPHHELSIRRSLGAGVVEAVIPGSNFITIGVVTVSSILILLLLSTLFPIYYIVEFSWRLGLMFCIILGLATLLIILSIKLHLVLILRNAQTKAETAFKTFRPNVIVASNLGAVVALRMKATMVPLILLSPAQGSFARKLFQNQTEFSLRYFPYVLICHGAADPLIPFDDTIRLCHTISEDRCHLISLDTSSSDLEEVITDDEMRDIILFTFHEGWISALMMSEEEMRKGQTVLDTSLINLLDIVSFATIALRRLQSIQGPSINNRSELSFGEDILGSLGGSNGTTEATLDTSGIKEDKFKLNVLRSTVPPSIEGGASRKISHDVDPWQREVKVDIGID